MIKGSNCCYQCEDRHIGCHSTCEKYQAYRKEWEERKKTYRKVIAQINDGYYHK